MPDWTAELRRRLRGAGLGGALEADVMDELAQHLDDRYRELRARGESEADAQRVALEELEEGDALARGLRRARREKPDPVAPGAPRDGPFVGVLADVRIAVRVLARTPGFTLLAALVIMLGVGANTTIFSVVNTVLLRPTPGVRAPDELVAVYTSDYSGPRYGASSYPDYVAMRDAGVFSEVTVYSPRPLNVTIGERAVKVLGEGVTPGYFDMLGVVPVRGRFFTQEEDGVDGSGAVAVISHGFWQDRLGGDPSIVGRELRVNGAMVTVVGIVPSAYRGMLRGFRTDVWTPMSAPASIVGTGHDNRGNRGFAIVGRLPEGSALETVQARLDGLAAQLHAEYPDFWTDVNDRARVLTVVPENGARVPPQARGAALGAVAGLMTIVAIVLLIACSNVANLMLTRASSRMSEMGVRLALGATRGRIMRQLLTEAVLLAALGGTGGVLLAFWLTRAVNTVSLPVDLPMTIDIALDGRVLVFALLITVLTGIVFGLLPALQMSRAPAPMMKATAASARPRMRLRNTLVVVQVASSLVLLTFGSLFLRTLRAADAMDTGMTTENVLLMHVDLAAEGYSDAEAEQLLTQLRERVAALPAVQTVAMSAYVPLGLGWSRRGIVVDEYTPQPG
ncbi:MAG TPA: ABC transporter permease [Longimicrobiales bacterium]|nr:ABC transporter permease [Longimicrobiales bacterium]